MIGVIIGAGSGPWIHDHMRLWRRKGKQSSGDVILGHSMTQLTARTWLVEPSFVLPSFLDGQNPRHTRRISLCPLSFPRSQTMQLRRENGGLSIYIPSPFLQMVLIRCASSCSAVRLYFTAGFCYLDSPFYLLVLRLETGISRYTCRARNCGQNGQTG